MGTIIEAPYYAVNDAAGRAALGAAPGANRTDPAGVGSALRRYGLALGFVCAALLLTLPLQHLFPHP